MASAQFAFPASHKCMHVLSYIPFFALPLCLIIITSLSSHKVISPPLPSVKWTKKRIPLPSIEIHVAINYLRNHNLFMNLCTSLSWIHNHNHFNSMEQSYNPYLLIMTWHILPKILSPRMKINLLGMIIMKFTYLDLALTICIKRFEDMNNVCWLEFGIRQD